MDSLAEAQAANARDRQIVIDAGGDPECNACAEVTFEGAAREKHTCGRQVEVGHG